MKKLRKKFFNLKTYTKFVVIYSLILVLMLCFLNIYSYFSLKSYEDNDINNYITNVVYDMSKKDLIKYTNIKDDKDIVKSYKNMLDSDKLKIEKVPKEDSLYNVSVGNKKIYQIEIEKGKSVTKFGVLSYKELSTKNIVSYLERGFDYIDLVVYDNYKVYVDNKLIKTKNKPVEIKDFKDIYAHKDMPKELTYELNNIKKDSKIVIKDHLGNIVKYKKEGSNIVTYDKYYTNEELNKVLNIDINPMDFAKNWSLFMSADLKGTYHGFTTLEPFMVKDSDTYKEAYNWSRGVDITFTSRHSLKNPPFTKESVSNCQIYNNESFSCDVYFEKNMRIHSTNIDKTDIFSQKVFYINDNNVWKVVDMTSVIKD